ncbi:MAG: hypothetical protein SOU50_00585, partial [Oscillospiraceae bacterium]|nr:hypothetical protein [Oscillospiraceae bacterium]MDY2846701.1 hypothetical protein [Oscillospiraceae bacterium]
VRIFEHNFVADKEKMRRRAGARQAFLTQYAAKFAEKTCAYACEDRFLNGVPIPSIIPKCSFYKFVLLYNIFVKYAIAAMLNP